MRYFSLTSCALLISGSFLIASAFAAEVPPDTQLNDRQELVRHLKDEPASLDPINAVGLTEAQVQRDLFEGLVNQDAYGNTIPGVATAWKTADNKTWFLRCVLMPVGQMGNRLLRRILCIVGSD
ncbi:hypothetical protein O185_18615 [Photorhabdus temperata J3]|uniref:Uncharacterized protein n=1 Tax=Photorhabdus temperata J3 TaxID=1389415 RepID=U7QUD7_PHOTE|nr:hypothetical protein O185_18615 [Photorhabdus temperata J3]